jgi:anti-sigma factor RsiW
MSVFPARWRHQICGPASRHRSAVIDVHASDRRGARSPHRSPLTAVVASSSTWFITGSEPANTVADTLVSDHIRALMAPQPTDVISSDRHTVKPWFNGRIPESPRVVDLAKKDFPLVGGRLDVVGQTPVPTLVYRHAQHLISLTEIPAGSRLEVTRTPRTINGYNVVHWTENGVSYWAISDLAASKLEDFAQLFRTTPAES